MYAELSASAKEDNPQPSVEQFLYFYVTVTRAGLVADSLLKTATSAAGSLDSSQTGVGPTILEESFNLSSEKRKLATSWINAALSTDLAPFTLYNHRQQPVHSAAVVLDSSAKSTSASSKPTASQLKSLPAKTSPTATATTPRGRARGPPPSPPREWARGGGLEEGTELARAMGEESRSWFVGFVERFLDADVGERLPWDRDLVAGMLSQLKKVNDWLDGAGRRGEVGGEMDGGDVPHETIERLRKKIYEYLLTHVESAAVALGSGGNSAGSSSAGGGERQGRKG